MYHLSNLSKLLLEIPVHFDLHTSFTDLIFFKKLNDDLIHSQKAS